MDGTRIQSLVHRGYALSARRVGLPHAHYRPVGAEDPVAHGGLLGYLDAAFSADEHRFKRPQGYGRATWSALVDGAAVRVGDYLIGSEAGATFFIAAKQHLLPILSVKCNAKVDVLRPAGQQGQGVGRVPYGGSAPDELLLAGWPVSMLAGTKGERPEADLPRSTRHPWYAVLLPAPPGVQIRSDDVLVDTQGERFLVSGAECTDLGWRLSVMQSGV